MLDGLVFLLVLVTVASQQGVSTANMSNKWRVRVSKCPLGLSLKGCGLHRLNLQNRLTVLAFARGVQCKGELLAGPSH